MPKAYSRRYATPTDGGNKPQLSMILPMLLPAPAMPTPWQTDLCQIVPARNPITDPCQSMVSATGSNPHCHKQSNSIYCSWAKPRWSYNVAMDSSHSRSAAAYCQDSIAGAWFLAGYRPKFGQHQQPGNHCSAPPALLWPPPTCRPSRSGCVLHAPRSPPRK